MNLRRIVLLTLYVATASGIAASQSFAQSGARLTLAQMEEMFRNIRATTKWNVEADLLWGYVFMDPQTGKLQLLADELSRTGYRVAKPYPSPDGRMQVLHAEKRETHTPQSLNQRNLEFYRLAEKYGIASYDGMDVGAADSQAKK